MSAPPAIHWTSAASSVPAPAVVASSGSWRHHADEMPVPPMRVVPNCVNGTCHSSNDDEHHHGSSHGNERWYHEEERQQRYIWSWATKPTLQQPQYRDQKQLRDALAKIRSLPPLVDRKEVDDLKRQLAECARGERFLLQGGDCAERFDDCRMETIECKLKIIMQMSLVLSWGTRIPTCRVGRIAGQYGKPRSALTEPVVISDGNGGTKTIDIPCFRGDNINSYEKTLAAREHDPDRLVMGHYHSAATLNHIRSLMRAGFADIHQSQHWDLSPVNDRTKRSPYQDIANQIVDSLDFIDRGAGGVPLGTRDMDFFTSHEALVLDYESAVTRAVASLAPRAAIAASSSPSSAAASSTRNTSSTAATAATSTTNNDNDNMYYNLGAHLLWIGDRTSSLDGGHVEYCSKIANPIGIKVGPTMKASTLVALCQRLDPHHEAGRLTLITRLGYTHVERLLPPLIRALHSAGLTHILWTCDPMHGNTYSTAAGVKTRDFEHILSELQTTFHVHQQYGSRLGGVHFELTGEHVTECVGGPEDLREKNLHLRYTSYCDPRLNYLQGMEMSFRLAHFIRDRPIMVRPALLPASISPLAITSVTAAAVSSSSSSASKAASTSVLPSRL